MLGLRFVRRNRLSGTWRFGRARRPVWLKQLAEFERCIHSRQRVAFVAQRPAARAISNPQIFELRRGTRSSIACDRRSLDATDVRLERPKFAKPLPEPKIDGEPDFPVDVSDSHFVEMETVGKKGRRSTPRLPQAAMLPEAMNDCGAEHGDFVRRHP